MSQRLYMAVRDFDRAYPLVLPLVFLLVTFVAYAYTTPPETHGELPLPR